MPSVETCTGGYSYTRTRIDTLMEYALVNASLVLQPGLYDAGLYIVVLVFGDDAYLRHRLPVGGGQPDYPAA